MDPVNRQKWDRVARGYDLMNGYGPERRWAPWKRTFFSAMGDGRILLAAVGTGLDISQFPRGRRVVAVDVSPGMIERARKRAREYPGRLDLVETDVQDLAFRSGIFDQIFTSCTFCSVPDPVAGLRELRRVLRPGGELRMFEHTGSRIVPFRWMLRLMTPLSRRFGPEMDRDTVSNVRRAGFRLTRVTNLYLDVVKTIVAIGPER